MEDLGKLGVVCGVLFIAAGLWLIFQGKIPGEFRFPGDIRIQRGGTVFYFPLGLSLGLSLILTLIFSLLERK